MTRKLQIISLTLVFCLFVMARAPGNKVSKDGVTTRLIIGHYGFEGTFGGTNDKTYLALQVFINNYNDDTLKYLGTNCRLNDFFNVTDGKKIYFIENDCSNPEFKVIVVPPHRSQMVVLKLAEDKMPKAAFNLNVSMNLYKWHKGSTFNVAKKNIKPEILTDQIPFVFYKQYNNYQSPMSEPEREKRNLLKLPTTNFYILTEADRKLMSVTVDEKEISKPIAIVNYNHKKVQLIQMPVTVRNNSNNTLSYFSMTCSWDEFYHVNNNKFSIEIQPCDKNFPRNIIIAPHGYHTQLVFIIYEKKYIKKGETFEVGVNINKNVPVDVDNYDELTRYNLVWSNEVSLPFN